MFDGGAWTGEDGRMRTTRHQDLSFEVGDKGSTDTMYVDGSLEEAIMLAVGRSVSGRGAQEVAVLTYSRAAAKAYGGDDAVEEYDMDPDASAHDRIIITAESLGRIA